MTTLDLPEGFEVAGTDDARAQTALAAYTAELVARFPQGFVGASTQTDAADHEPPRGLFLIHLSDDTVTACGALRHLDADRSEIKRMWVSPTARGQGLASRLLQALEHAAAAAGRRTVVLDTNDTLTEAVRLYVKHGYITTSPYNTNEHATHWFAKTL